MQDKFLVFPVLGAIFFVGTLLSGCTSVVGHKTIKTTVDIPAETFECEAASLRPSGDKIMESDVARYINSLEFAEKDCRTRLKEVQVLIKCSNEPKCDPKLLTELLAVAKPPKHQ
jgi:hypothetical protein